jgi:hypothetical protein
MSDNKDDVITIRANKLRDSVPEWPKWKLGGHGARLLAYSRVRGMVFRGESLVSHKEAKENLRYQICGWEEEDPSGPETLTSSSPSA